MKSVLISSLLFLTACTSTQLDPPQLHPKIVEVLELPTNKHLSLKVSNECEKQLGHQYLLVALPFGRITHSSAEEALRVKLVTQLVLAGYRPSSKKNGPTAGLVVDIKEIQLSAYDLFFIRRIYSKLVIEGTLTDTTGIVLRREIVTTEDSSHKPFAFQRELQNIMDKTVDQSVSSLLQKLGLSA